jgi:tetratricopeptide (TPR) repeat protein
MILDISLTAERKRLALVKFTPRAEPTTQAAAPAISEEERLLNQGDNFFFEGRYNDAKTAYRTVLEKFNAKSGRALFGMAVVESNLGKPDLAEEYFQKTLEMGRDLRIITWSHIYLGRIWDLKGQRAKALSQYRAASLTATAFPDAWGAVQAGLERPFGSRP